jgi:hypothetical protein
MAGIYTSSILKSIGDLSCDIQLRLATYSETFLDAVYRLTS